MQDEDLVTTSEDWVGAEEAGGVSRTGSVPHAVDRGDTEESKEMTAEDAPKGVITLAFTDIQVSASLVAARLNECIWFLTR